MRYWFTRDAMFPAYVFCFAWRDGVYVTCAIGAHEPYIILSNIYPTPFDTLH